LSVPADSPRLLDSFHYAATFPRETVRIGPGVAVESVYSILDLYKIPVLKGLG
jgi:hypothetical protein